MLLTLDHLIPREHYTAKDISPHFWPNGKMPVREDWKQLAAEDFKSYKLKVSGLVENPVELSLDDLRVLGLEENITMHHCIQGRSGIAQWGGVSMRKLIEHVKPLPSANVVAFYSFGGSLYGDLYYDTQTLFNALKTRVSSRTLHEWCSIAGRIWSAAASAGGKPAWLQDGEVD
jgi:sulfoxide reductase catalytic subunit YedY